jgi:hypothetical protein
MNESEDTCVHVASGEFNAQQVRAFLEVHGITCEFHGEALRMTHGLTLNGLGEVRVHVRPEHVDRARQLLESVEAGEMNLEEKP